MSELKEKIGEVLEIVKDLSPESAFVVLTAAIGARADTDGKDAVAVFQRAATIAAIRDVKEKMARDQT
jgi:hypothetical protein